MLSRCLATAGAFVVMAHASAQISAVGPFVGAISEGFEGFANGTLPSPTATFGGAAQLTGPANYVYEPGVANFLLAGNGFATTASGAKGLGVNSNEPTSALFTFNSVISQFGGYFAHSDNPLNRVVFRFFDVNAVQIGSDQIESHAGNSMDWYGYSSTIGIKQVEIFGRFPVMDDLQANPVPEPFTMGLAGLALAAAARKRMKRSA